jgi:hypothetical protein
MSDQLQLPRSVLLAPTRRRRLATGYVRWPVVIAWWVVLATLLLLVYGAYVLLTVSS